MTDAGTADRGTDGAAQVSPAGAAAGADIAAGGGDIAARASAAESLPLAQRADAFSALHEELRDRLEHGGVAGA